MTNSRLSEYKNLKYQYKLAQIQLGGGQHGGAGDDAAAAAAALSPEEATRVATGRAAEQAKIEMEDARKKQHIAGQIAHLNRNIGRWKHAKEGLKNKLEETTANNQKEQEKLAVLIGQAQANIQTLTNQLSPQTALVS